MKNSYTESATADTKGERVDVFLTRKFPEFSRSFFQKLCKQGGVALKEGNQQIDAKYKLAIGQTVELQLPKTLDFSAETIPVIFEDDDVIVVNKPSGMLTHAKGEYIDEFTVAEFMRSRTTDNSESNRPGIVHRLDRDTSGVLIAAKNNEAKRWLQKQFAERKVKKAYLALVQGRPKQPTAILQLPLERNPSAPQTYRVGANGKPAETLYETVQEFKNYTLLLLKPHTGRTHQLRVHMKYIGCPIANDALYGKAAPHLHRMFLHAAELELTLPSRERKVFKAPLPPDLQAFLDTLE